MRILRLGRFALILLAALSACEKEPGDIFEDSSRNRLLKVLDRCQSTLSGAENGWNMQYFINSESGGYNLLAGFNDSQEAVFAGKNFYTGNEYLEQKSSYQLNGSNGPVLAFNTYNEVLHVFADPDDYALGGDFEFVILDVAEDTVLLKGKKNQTKIILKKIAPGVSWQAYLQGLDSVQSFLFSAGAPELTLTIDGDKPGYAFSGASGSVFTVEREDPDTTFTLPFIITQTGLRMAEPESFTGRGVQTFRLNEDNSALVAVEDPQVQLKGPDSLAVYFLSSSVNWRFDSLNMTTNVKTLYDQVIESCKNTYDGASDIFVALKGIPGDKRFALNLHFVYNRKNVEALLYFDRQASGQKEVSLAYLGTGNNAGKALAKSIAGFEGLANLISGEFEISTDSPVSPKNIEFSKTGDGGIRFLVKRK